MPVMRVDEQAMLGRVLDTGRFGLAVAQQRLDDAAQDLAELDPALYGDDSGDGALAYAPSYMVEDIVELSRARIGAQASAASIKSANDATSELTNVGRRIDLRA